MKLPVISLAILAGQAFWAYRSAGDLAGRLDNFQSLYTGVDFSEGFAFHAERLVGGYAPWLIKRFVGAVAKPRMPIHGIPISLS